MSNAMLAEVETRDAACACGDVVMQVPAKFVQSPRIQLLARRSRELAISGKRRLGSADAPLGDHACWIHIGPFPYLDQLPSRANGYEATGESWGRDYAFLVDHFPIEIHPNERIVGEIHWEMHMVRQYVWPESVNEVARKCAPLGASGHSSGHTCPDLASASPRASAVSWNASRRAGRSTPGSTTRPRPPTCTAWR